MTRRPPANRPACIRVPIWISRWTTPERGADDSPTREMAPRDEPTVESELMNFADSPTAGVAGIEARRYARSDFVQARRSTRRTKPPSFRSTTLGLDLDHIEGRRLGASISIPRLEETDHPADAPTMVAGLDEKSRRMMQEAESRARDKDLTELERELEASFVADLGSDHEEIKTAVLGPESAPTVQMPRGTTQDPLRPRVSSRPNSRMCRSPSGPMWIPPRAARFNADSIDLDLDRLANALGIGRHRRAAACGRRSIFRRGIRGQPAAIAKSIWMSARRSTARKPRQPTS